MSPVADRHGDYANDVAAELRSEGLRIEVDHSRGKLGEKVRRAITTKSASLLVVGDDDVANRTAGFRMRGDTEERGVGLEAIVGALTEAAKGPGGL